MDTRFQAHNSHLDDPGLFCTLDPHLRLLQKQPLVYRSHLLNRLPFEKPGIYTIGGGRQIGKTTLLKQWMAHLIDQGTVPGNIAFFTGELIDDHHSLVRILTYHMDGRSLQDVVYIMVDEVTYIRGWDKGVKYLADAGMLENVVLILTGSDVAIIKEARMRFPGRRGYEAEVDFHIYPLSFADTVLLKGHFTDNVLEVLIDPNSEVPVHMLENLFEEFDYYLIHGGFLTAINDMARDNRIPPTTFTVYSDWIRGDVLKRGKQGRYLRELLDAMTKRLGSQVTWNNLAQDLSIDHPKTIADYLSLLESMDVAFIQPALIEDKLAGAPKKPRKLMFTDPFIHHAIKSWLNPVKDPFEEQVKPAISDSDLCSRLAEACATCQVRRDFRTFYIKAEGEVDIAYIEGRTFWPVEVKWTKQSRPKDIKQIVKYANGRIWSRSLRFGKIQGVPAEPLPLALFRMGMKSKTSR